MEKEKFSLKDHLFNSDKIDKIASEILAVYPSFQKKQFATKVLNDFPELELKERIYHITTCLNEFLPDTYEEAVEILIRSLPKPCNPNLSDNDFGDFIYAPYAHFIAMYGCTKKHFYFSLNALEQITMRFSVEDAIRYFINAFPEESLAKMKVWSQHPHYHVRRLSCEGSRPKLPWCQKINIQIEQTLPILDNLFADKTRYVTRSVANHLNDISKTNPELVIKTLKKWKNKNTQQPKEMDFIIRHSLRTLIKKGYKNALQLIGITQNPAVKLKSFSISDKVKMDTSLEFAFDLQAREKATLMVDYLIIFQNKKGEISSKKVFKLKHFTLGKNESISISKKHLMKQYMTTRTLYAGKQEFALQINGEIVKQNSFSLY